MNHECDDYICTETDRDERFVYLDVYNKKTKEVESIKVWISTTMDTVKCQIKSIISFNPKYYED